MPDTMCVLVTYLNIPYTLMCDIGLKGNKAITVTVNSVTLIILCNVGYQFEH